MKKIVWFNKPPSLVGYMMNSVCTSALVLLMSLTAIGIVPEAEAADSPILIEDFESPKTSGLYASLLGHPNLSIADAQGVGNSKALKAAYVGYERGSQRIVVHHDLPERGTEYTLCQDVKFDGDFQFVKGGKLHGLGPAAPITGGEPMTPEGWSARVMFRDGGKIQTYLYHQDKQDEYGDTITSNNFLFERGKYHAVCLHVKLNSPANTANGFAHIYADGVKVVGHENIRFRGAENESTLISKLLFNTFHGGSSPEWAPRDANGNYTTVFAYFDNIAVYRGKYVRPSPSSGNELAGTNLITDGGFEGGSLLWNSTKSILTLDPAAAYAGQSGMKVDSAYGWCPYGALYTLDTSRLQNGTMYEFGARIRLANSADTSANHIMGLIKNGASPIWLDGYDSAYGAYPDKWTRLYSVWKASFSPTDNLKLCINGTAANKPFQVDEAFVKPLTTNEVGYQPPATLDTSTLVYADGNRLVMGPQKTPFLMKGINVYLYDPGNDVDPPPPLDDFKYKNVDEASYKEIRDLGFNSVRLMLSYNLFENSTAPGVYKNEGWALVDRHIQWAKQNGLRLILDMHVPPGGYQSTDFKGFGSRADLKKRLEDLWVVIAQRYRNETSIAAYDLINEPHINNWFIYAQTLIDKIRAVDPNHLIDVELSFHPSDKGMYKLADDNILYDVHYYTPWGWTGSLTNNTPYTGTLEQFKQQLRTEEGLSEFYDAATDSFTVPFNIGEYGVTFGKYELPGVNGVTWLQHANAAFDHFGLNRQLFHYNEYKFGIYRSWNSYPNEHTKTTVALKTALPAINGAEPPPPPPPPALDITTTNLTKGTVGTAYSAQVSANGGTSPYTWSLATGSLPAGLTLGSDGKITGTPTNAGTFSFTLAVTDQKAATDTQAVSMTVEAQPVVLPPDITTTSLTAGTVGKTYSATLNVSKGTAPYSWLVDSGNLPAGLSLSTAGVLSGTPTTAGASSFSVKVTDRNNLADTQTLSLAINAAPPATGNADMALTVFKATKTSVTKGTAAEFSLTVKNNGKAAASNARFVLPLPANMVWVKGGHGSECSATATQVTCNFGSLANTSSRTRSIYLRPTVAGSYALEGVASSDESDSNMTNNSKAVTLTVK